MKHDGLMIRKADLDDCIDIAALSLQVWLHTYATQGVRHKISRYALSTFTEKSFQALLKNPSFNIWLCIVDVHLVGFVVVDLDSRYEEQDAGYEIKTLYVSPHFQGRGIGRQLLETVQNEHGIPYWLSTWVNNTEAIAFYRKLGFELIGELNFELDDETYQNHVFRCSTHGEKL